MKGKITFFRNYILSFFTFWFVTISSVFLRALIIEEDDFYHLGRQGPFEDFLLRAILFIVLAFFTFLPYYVTSKLICFFYPSSYIDKSRLFKYLGVTIFIFGLLLRSYMSLTGAPWSACLGALFVIKSQTIKQTKAVTKKRNTQL